MDAAHDTKRQLGQLMVDEGFLTLEQLAHALEEQGRTGRPLGTLLVELGFVSEGAVANALAEQHGGLLKTEFGVSAGLHALPSEPAQVELTPEPPDRATRIEQLESVLRTVVNERDAFAGKANELQLRLTEATQKREAEVAHVTACAAAKIDELEAELQAQSTEPGQPNELDVAQAAAAAARIADLETEVQAALAARVELENAVRLGTTRISELQHEVTELQARSSKETQLSEADVASATAAAGRIAELEAELQARLSEPELPNEADVERTTAAAARIAELEAALQSASVARSELESAVRLGAARISELQLELTELEQRRRDEPTLAEATVEDEVEHAHHVLTPTPSGYTLVERPGPSPASGTLLDVDGAGFFVLRVGASPFPGSRLRCVFLERS